MKLATIKTLVNALPADQQGDLRTGGPNFKGALAMAKKRGWAVTAAGRVYVPEALRGKGVGYGCHGHG